METGPRIVGDFQPGQPLALTIDNRYEFTNLSELTLEWAAGSEHGALHPDVAPRTTRQITIPLGPSVKPGDMLDLRFGDRHGMLVFPWRLQLGEPKVVPVPIRVASPLQRKVDVMLEGTFQRIIGQGFEIAFDGNSGSIRRAMVGDHSVIYGTPKLHLLARSAGWEDAPEPQSWRLTQPLKVEAIGEDYVVTATGTYGSPAGNLRYRITPAGEMDVSYQFIYSGSPGWMKETGLQFGMPLWCDTLQWRRKGEWAVYPEDAIGRNEGSAHAHAQVKQVVPPRQSWAQDDTPLGTNDFRSTKRSFIDAALLDSDGYGVGILANGTQHLRAEVGPDEIYVNVNDWYGGTSAEVPEWYTVYGRGRLMRALDPNTTWEDKGVLEGTVRLFLVGPDRLPQWQNLQRAHEAEQQTDGVR
jgi:Beta galactosidase small chain